MTNKTKILVILGILIAGLAAILLVYSNRTETVDLEDPGFNRDVPSFEEASESTGGTSNQNSTVRGTVGNSTSDVDKTVDEITSQLEAEQKLSENEDADKGILENDANEINNLTQTYDEKEF